MSIYGGKFVKHYLIYGKNSKHYLNKQIIKHEFNVIFYDNFIYCYIPSKIIPINKLQDKVKFE